MLVCFAVALSHRAEKSFAKNVIYWEQPSWSIGFPPAPCRWCSRHPLSCVIDQRGEGCRLQPPTAIHRHCWLSATCVAKLVQFPATLRNLWFPLAPRLTVSCVGQSVMLDGRGFDHCRDWLWSPPGANGRAWSWPAILTSWTGLEHLDVHLQCLETQGQLAAFRGSILHRPRVLCPQKALQWLYARVGWQLWNGFMLG
jgi:hypothetical protein